MSSRPSARLANKQKNDPQHVFRRLSVLEVEKKIVCQARRDAVRRVRKIDEKLKELDKTIADLLSRLDLHSYAKGGSPDASSREVSSSTPFKGKDLKEATHRPAGDRGFIVRY